MVFAFRIFRQLKAATSFKGIKGLFVSFVILSIVGLLLAPLSPVLLDFLLVLNIVVALTLLLRGLFATDVLELHAFPSILLFTTLYRLALNISSTQLILSHGDQGISAAGQVIEAFGRVVIGSDFVVGAVIFTIIAVVNYLVIAKGSARVAEVAARFALDSLPGKQLSIDADLRSGNISREEASKRRAILTQESQFYGAMDGAMRFVQGDAIACLVIAAVNAFGGVAIGLYRGLEFSEAVNTFGVLTVGDGLVSIVPSLLISICAGVVVTRVVGKDARSTSETIYDYMVAEPFVPVIISVLFVFIPFTGFPILPFLSIGVLLFFGGLYKISLGYDRGYINIRSDIHKVGASASVDIVNINNLLSNDILSPADTKMLPFSDNGENSIFEEFSPELIRIIIQQDFAANYSKNYNEVFQRCSQFAEKKRRELFQSRGILLPELRFSVDKALSQGGYSVLVREQAVRRGVLNANNVFVATSKGTLFSLGIEHVELVAHPISGSMCCWIENDRSALRAIQTLGVEVFEPFEFLVMEAYGAAFEVIEEVFGFDDTMRMLEQLRHDHGLLVERVVDSDVMSHTEFAEIIKRLVKERVSIRDFKLILEGITEFLSMGLELPNRSEWLTELHAFLRIVLSRRIIGETVSAGGALRAFVLSDAAESAFKDAISIWDGARTKPPVDPFVESALRTNALRMFQPVLERGAVPIVLLCSAEVRYAVQEFFAQNVLSADSFRTIAYEELRGKCYTEPVGVIQVAG